MTCTLLELERAFRQSWSADTTCLAAASRARWRPDGPAYGQCGPTALVVQDLLGGVLLIADVTGGDEENEVHYWNQLPGGLEIDLTREQFKPHRIIGKPRIVVRPPQGPLAYAEEYQLLRARVFSALALSPTDRKFSPGIQIPYSGVHGRVALMLSDFVKAWNQGQNVDLYEKENEAIDHDGLLWQALQASAPWDGKNLLDLGCGSGYWLPRYASTTLQLYGVEPDTSLLEAAISRTPRAEVLHGSAEHIPLDDSSVDVIHARFAYFFPSPTNDCSAGVAEALRVLRPGGSLVVIDNDQEHGDFADLLQVSNAADHQGPSQFIRRWWHARGATTQEVMSSWTFNSREDLQEVLNMEFPQGTAQPWIEAHPDQERLSYGYLLHVLTKPGC